MANLGKWFKDVVNELCSCFCILHNSHLVLQKERYAWLNLDNVSTSENNNQSGAQPDFSK